MKPTDLIDQVKACLEENGYKVRIGRIDRMVGKEGICLREVHRRRVSSAWDREKTYAFVYQIVVRSRDQSRAEGDCWDITALLDGAVLDSANGSYEFDSQEVYTSPQELELKENLFYAWNVRFEALIRQKEG